MTTPYRFPIPAELNPQAVLKVAQRLAEAAREGYDVSRTSIEGRFYVVPPRRSRSEAADQLRDEVVAHLTKYGPLTVGEVARDLHLTPGRVGYLMTTLVRQGRLQRVGKAFEVKEAA